MSRFRHYSPSGIALALVLATLPDPGAHSADEKKAAGPGRIALYAWYEDEGDGNGVIVVDPTTDTVEKVFDVPQANGPILLADFRLSPDGRRIAYGKLESIDGLHCRHASIWLRDLRPDGEARKISDLGGWPIWSSDGKQLLVCEALGDKNPEKVSRFASWTIDNDGSHAVRLPIPDTFCVDDWSADGRWLAGIQSLPGQPHDWEIVVMHPDGTGRKALTVPGQGFQPRFSPDGRHVAFVSSTIDRGDRIKGKSIEVVDLDGKNRRRVYDEPKNGQIDRVAWSPDGKHLATILLTWALTKTDLSPRLGNPRLCLIDAADGKVRFVPHRGATVLGHSQWR